MIEFSITSAPTTHTLKVETHKVTKAQFGFLKEELTHSITSDQFLDFFALLQPHKLEKKYYLLMLDGWHWELKQDGKLISKGSNTMPDEVRHSMRYILNEINFHISIIPEEHQLKPIILKD